MFDDLWIALTIAFGVGVRSRAFARAGVARGRGDDMALASAFAVRGVLCLLGAGLVASVVAARV